MEVVPEMVKLFISRLLYLGDCLMGILVGVRFGGREFSVATRKVISCGCPSTDSSSEPSVLTLDDSNGICGRMRFLRDFSII